MVKKIVSDSSTLILLARSGMIERMECVFLIPTSVYEESIKRGKEKGFEDAYLLDKLEEFGWYDRKLIERVRGEIDGSR